MPISLTWKSLQKLPKKLAGTLVIQAVDLPRVRSLTDAFMPGITVASAASTILLLCVTVWLKGERNLWPPTGITLAVTLLLLWINKLNQRGHVSLAVNLVLAIVTLYLTLVLPAGFLETGAGPGGYAVPPVVAAMTINPAAALVWTVIVTLAMLARLGWITIFLGMSFDPIPYLFATSGIYLLALVAWLFSRSFQQANQTLRQRVRQVQTGVEISNLITAALDPAEVTRQAVRLIQQGFGYYHVGLFLLNPEDRWATLAEAAGSSAPQLLEAGHRIPLAGTPAGVTSVAAAITQKRRQIVALWTDNKGPDGRPLQFNNRLLPSSRVELAIPMQVGDRVLGALDIHTDELAPFPEENIQSLEGVAAQIAVALENARLFEDIQQRHQELSEVYKHTERRAHYMQTTAELARTISSLSDQQELLDNAVRLIGEGLELYHVGVFLVDEAGEWAVLRAASSEGGKQMLARQHRLRVGEQGIVGWTTSTGQSRVALDVGEDAVYFDNPDMPDTHSEVALPLKRGDRVIGALDVQSTQVAAFTEEDASVLQTLADQIAIAIENARLFQQTQAAFEELQTLQRHYVSHEWRRLTSQQTELAAEYNREGVASLRTSWPPEMKLALNQEAPVSLPDLSTTDLPDDDHGGGANDLSSLPALSALAVPIKLRGEVIGVLDLQETDEPRNWTEEEMAMVSAVADQVALALENARLLEETRRRAERERLAGQITARIRAAGDMDAILRTTVQEVRRALGVSHGLIRLGTEAQLKATGGGRQAAEGDKGNER
jgi:GAF domain-containing protein